MTEKKPKKWLTEQETLRTIDLAKSRSMRDYLLLSLMRWGIRVGEIVGHKRLPGIHAEEVRTTTIWISRKGYARVGKASREVAVDQALLQLLRSYIVDNKIGPKDKVFPITERRAEQIVDWYAERATLEDWERVSPHRFRAFLATDAKIKGVQPTTIKDLMDHEKWETTVLYIGRSSKEELVNAVSGLAPRPPLEKRPEPQ